MADAMMKPLGEANGVKWYWAEPGRFEKPGVYYWNGSNNVLCVPYRAAPGAPAVAQVPHHYRKKPVVIEAHQWDGTESGIQRIKAHFPALQTLAKTGHLRRDEVTHWRIGTLEGGHEVSKGDWIIKGIKGEFYPCKPDIFDATYEAASPEAPAQAAQSAGEVGRGDVVAFEFYNRATGHAIVDYSVNTHVGNLSAAKGYEARPLVYAAPRQNVLDGSKPIPAWQAREALDELEAAARGDAPFNHQAAAVVRAALSHKEPQR